MEAIDTYGKNITDLPGFTTLKALEKRQAYLFTKLQDRVEENTYFAYITKEMRALEKTKNFIKWILVNSSDDMIKAVVKKYKEENKSDTAGEEADEEAGEDEEVYGVIREKCSKTHSIEIVLSRVKGVEYVTLESKHKETDGVTWTGAGKIAVTLHKLEKIIRKAKDFHAGHPG